MMNADLSIISTTITRNLFIGECMRVEFKLGFNDGVTMTSKIYIKEITHNQLRLAELIKERLKVDFKIK